MFIRFDYRCLVCKHQEERFVKKEDMDLQVCLCGDNPVSMLRLPAAPRTTFRFADNKLKR